jgi:hypothetical protein
LPAVETLQKSADCQGVYADTHSEFNRRQILVVNDDFAICEFLSETLKDEGTGPTKQHRKFAEISVICLKNIAPDLPPKPGLHKSVSRDYEYKRLGIVSILAALDLHTGKIIAQVHDRHRSMGFIELLKELDDYYPPQCMLRIVLVFLSAAGICRVPMTLFEASFLGWRFTCIRFAVSLPLVVFFSAVVGCWFDRRRYRLPDVDGTLTESKMDPKFWTTREAK